MDPGTYDYAFYEAQVRQQVKQHEVIVFDAVFCPPNYSSELILVAGTSSGELYFYAVGPLLVCTISCKMLFTLAILMII
jgi:hypothetical protein